MNYEFVGSPSGMKNHSAVIHFMDPQTSAYYFTPNFENVNGKGEKKPRLEEFRKERNKKCQKGHELIS